MNRCDVEICGFLDVKPARNRYIAQKMRKKTLTSSKVWKRYWCSVMKLEYGHGIKVQFDSKLGYSSNSSTLKDKNEKNNFVVIPPSAVVHRIYSKTKKFAFAVSAATDRKLLLSLSGNSETEAQRWMTNIRHLLKPRTYSCAEKSYDVSVIDNKHSRAAGLTGLHGDLSTDKVGIFIKDIHTGEIARSFEWKEFGQFHLMTAGRPEDVKRICVMHTTKEFCRGIGELHMFCLNANKLLQDLVTQGRGAKRRQSALSSDDENFQSSQQCNKVAIPQKRKCNALTCFARESNSQEELDASFASGVYEEIVDDVCSSIPRTVTSNTNNDANDILCYDNLQMTPPPLPPRWTKKTEYVDKFSHTEAEQYSEIKVLEEDSEKRLSSTAVYKRTIDLIESSDYVPMSPQWKNINILRYSMENPYENDYLMMR